jgi:hypothetical protein
MDHLLDISTVTTPGAEAERAILIALKMASKRVA